jgi:hypothetical protein
VTDAVGDMMSRVRYTLPLWIKNGYWWGDAKQMINESEVLVRV